MEKGSVEGILERVSKKGYLPFSVSSGNSALIFVLFCSEEPFPDALGRKACSVGRNWLGMVDREVRRKGGL
jgi:hypothetical protein